MSIILKIYYFDCYYHYYYYYLCVCMCMCVCVFTCVCEGQKKALDTLELELHVVKSYLNVGARNQTCVLCKSNKHY